MRHLAAARGDPVFPAKNLLAPRGGVLKNNVQSYGAFKSHGIHIVFEHSVETISISRSDVHTRY